MKLTTCIVALLALTSSLTGADGFFPVGVWYEGGVGALRHNLIPEDPALAAKDYQRDFADMAAHGVNAAVVPNTQPDHFKPLLDAAQANGVKLIIELGHEGAELGQMVRGSIPLSSETVRTALDAKLSPIVSHPALYGVQILDEPAPGTYERYATIAKDLKSYAPHLLPFCCLIGDGPVDSFCKLVKPEVVAFDCYPIGIGHRIGDPGPLLAFNNVTRSACAAAAKYDVPVWAVIQTHSITGIHRFPTPAELRCMTYLALANGCKGIWWFLYQTEYWDKSKNEFMCGLVDQEFRGGDRWDEIAKLTAEIKKLSPRLLQLEHAADVAVNSDGVAHVLKDARGGTYVFAVNTDTIATRKVTLRLDSESLGKGDPTVKRLPDGKTFEWIKLGKKLIWTAQLAPGDGALFEVKPGY